MADPQKDWIVGYLAQGLEGVKQGHIGLGEYFTICKALIGSGMYAADTAEMATRIHQLGASTHPPQGPSRGKAS